MATHAGRQPYTHVLMHPDTQIQVEQSTNVHRFVSLRIFWSCSLCSLSACRKILAVVSAQMQIPNLTLSKISTLALILSIFPFIYHNIFNSALPLCPQPSFLAAIQSGPPKRRWRMSRTVPNKRQLLRRPAWTDREVGRIKHHWHESDVR